MSLTEHYYTQFEEGKCYHIFNQGVDQKPLFTQKRNYYFFKSRMVKYVIPYLDVYAFCLLENHFHLLVKIKRDLATLKELPNLRLPESAEAANQEAQFIPKPNCHSIISSAFRKMFQSYAMAFNKQENRIGALFQEPFKRCELHSDLLISQMIHYIHFNPQLHGQISDFRSYPQCSYYYYLQKRKGLWMNKEVLKLFHGYEGFLEVHGHSPEITKERYTIESINPENPDITHLIGNMFC